MQSPNPKTQQILDHAQSRMDAGTFSEHDLAILNKAAFPDAIDRALSPSPTNSEWAVAYREALPLVKQEWQARNQSKD
ncbi:hypothetical protein [Idiomarina abyssalis]|uniref:hypothetical protein n=1 Tax=Idiomarina abyssalis TaxID=86102 RepID=UPI003A8CB9BA